MKKIICKEFGPVDNLVWEDTEDHEPLPNEVVVDIKAAALNFPDYLIVQGLYQFQPPLPFTPGNEGAGIIKKIGSEVTKHKVGDRVSFMSAIGAFAEEIVLDQNLVFKMQDEMSFEVAASYQLAYGTSYHALVQRGNLSKDDEVLVLGGSGGVGLAAIDIAKAVGARVVAAVSSQEKAQICSDYGADDIVLYGSSKLEKEQQKTFTSELKAKSIKGGFDLRPNRSLFCGTIIPINWLGRKISCNWLCSRRDTKITIESNITKRCFNCGCVLGYIHST